MNGFKAYMAGVGTVLVLGAVVAAAVIFSGRYPVGADVPHHRITHQVLTLLRENAIQHAAADIVVPSDLDSPARLLSGGADYNDMCAGCHLKPGKSDSDLATGLYPSPPNLQQKPIDPAAREVENRRRFWIIKHGIKASGMPAWGSGHDDERIWSMVAFLQRLPELTPVQYQILTARGSE